MKEKIKKEAEEIISTTFDESWLKKTTLSFDELRVLSRLIYSWRVTTKSTADEENCSGTVIRPIEALRKTIHIDNNKLYLILNDLESKYRFIDWERGKKRTKDENAKAAKFTIYFDTIYSNPAPSKIIDLNTIFALKNKKNTVNINTNINKNINISINSPVNNNSNVNINRNTIANESVSTTINPTIKKSINKNSIPTNNVNTTANLNNSNDTVLNNKSIPSNKVNNKQYTNNSNDTVSGSDDGKIVLELNQFSTVEDCEIAEMKVKEFPNKYKIVRTKAVDVDFGFNVGMDEKKTIEGGSTGDKRLDKFNDNYAKLEERENTYEGFKQLFQYNVERTLNGEL